MDRGSFLPFSLLSPPLHQSVYNTSHHALINLARIRKGETVLIHSAAGGIGHAAISIAKHVGAVIYATAGSEEKRQLVREMGVEHVYNSRNLSWFDDLMRDTNGQGVDVVLNSLAGKHQRLGVQALRSSGRFLEIGKMVRACLPAGLVWCHESAGWLEECLGRLTH